MNKDIFQLGVVTSFIYTVVYIAKNNVILDYEYVKNIDFQKEICSVFDVFFNKYDISFIGLFLGPAPLMSCRSTLIFMQGFYISLNIPIVLLKGYNNYRYKFFDNIIIQNFCGNYVLLGRGMKKQIINILELEKINFTDKKVALVCREGHSINIGMLYSVILFPNIDNLSKLFYKKYQNNKFLKKFSDIVPFF